MRASHRSYRIGAVALGLLCGGAPAADAGGLYLPGVGIIAQSRAGAYVANADDASALGVNPAGLSKQSGTVITVGAAFIDYALTFQRNGNYESAPERPWAGDPYPEMTDESKPAIGIGPFQAIPTIAISTDLGLGGKVPGLRFGFGIIAPSAYPNRDFGSDYEHDDPVNPPPPTRYDTVVQEAAVVLPSMAVAYRINDMIDVGGRFSWGIGEVKGRTYVWGSTNYEEDIGQEARFDVESRDNFVPAFGLGVLVRPTDAIEVGLNWDSQVNVHAKGTGDSVASAGLEIGGMPVVITPPPDNLANCAPGGVEGALKACVDIGLPMVTTLGGRYILRDARGFETADVELDVAWERWSAVSDHHVVVDGQALGSLPLNETFIRHGAKDVISVRLGGGYALPVGANAVALRGGIAHDTAAVRDTWERVDFDGAARTTFAVGGSFEMRKISIHGGFGFVYEGTRDVGTDCNPAPGTGCDEDGGEEPNNDRVGPDPAQPLNSGTPFQSPFNAGTYKSHYVLFSLGVTARF